MVRATLFTLLALVLIQVALALPYGYKKIFNVAANGALLGYPDSAPVVQKDFQGVAFSMWGINRFEDGASVFMPPANAFLNVNWDNKLIVRGDISKWLFQPAGSEVYLIKLPNKDLVLDWDERSEEVSLQPANGSPTQLWFVPTSYSYSRMFYQ
ncbi:hypothetical protein EC968_008420 [Mortierella alpina]|nr:hypothetical protein EC968_008420 [Mortierella alpina]